MNVTINAFQDMLNVLMDLKIDVLRIVIVVLLIPYTVAIPKIIQILKITSML